MRKSELSIAFAIAVLVVVVVTAVLLAICQTGTVEKAAEVPEKTEEPPAEQYASDQIEEEAFAAPGAPMHVSAALSDSGEQLAKTMGDAVPIVNATFAGMPFHDFMSRMMQAGVTFVVHDQSCEGFSRITATSPIVFEATDAETLVALNPRYCRIGREAEGTRDVVASWRQSRGGAADAPEILMFLPRHIEWAVLGALASATPPPADVATYRGEYRPTRDSGVELVIHGAATRAGSNVPMGTTVAF